MASETTVMRPRVIKALRSLSAIPVENSVGPGTPDVNYVEGWIELKHLDGWPAKGGVLRVEHYTPQQRIWHRRRRVAGGQCWMLLQVGQEWLLFDAAVACYTVGVMNRDELRFNAELWMEKFDQKELLKCVSQNQSNYWSTAEGKVLLNARLQRCMQYL